MSVLADLALWLTPRVLLGVLLVLLGARVLVRAPAQLRHVLLASGLLGSLLLPLLAGLGPVIELPILPVVQAPAVVPAVPGDAGPAQLNAWVVLLPLVWLLGTGLVAWRSARGLLGLRHLSGSLRAPAARLEERWNVWCREKRLLSRQARLAQSAEICAPVSWGVWRPVVVFPECAENWSRERLDEALIHELAHLRRADWLTERLADLCCAIYWFLPPVWLTSRCLRLEAERACDDEVLMRCPSRADYAAHLLVLARRGQPLMALSMAGRARPSQLARRIRAILDPEQRRHDMRRSLTLMVLSLCVGLFVTLAAVRATAAQAETQSSTPVAPSVSEARLPAPEAVPILAAAEPDVPEPPSPVLVSAVVEPASPESAPEPEAVPVAPSAPEIAREANEAARAASETLRIERERVRLERREVAEHRETLRRELREVERTLAEERRELDVERERLREEREQLRAERETLRDLERETRRAEAARRAEQDND